AHLARQPARLDVETISRARIEPGLRADLRERSDRLPLVTVGHPRVCELELLRRRETRLGNLEAFRHPKLDMRGPPFVTGIHPKNSVPGREIEASGEPERAARHHRGGVGVEAEPHRAGARGRG